VIGAGLGVNYIYPNGKQAEHIAWIIKRCFEDRIVAVEPTSEAEEDWRKTLDDSNSAEGNPIVAEYIAARGACTPGYLNNEGDANDTKGIFANVYGFGASAYIRLLESWREAEPAMPGLTITHEETPVA
jgi:cyclohexanone monooxygenase